MRRKSPALGIAMLEHDRDLWPRASRPSPRCLCARLAAGQANGVHPARLPQAGTEQGTDRRADAHSPGHGETPLRRCVPPTGCTHQGGAVHRGGAHRAGEVPVPTGTGSAGTSQEKRAGRLTAVRTPERAVRMNRGEQVSSLGIGRPYTCRLRRIAPAACWRGSVAFRRKLAVAVGPLRLFGLGRAWLSAALLSAGLVCRRQRQIAEGLWVYSGSWRLRPSGFLGPRSCLPDLSAGGRGRSRKAFGAFVFWATSAFRHSGRAIPPACKHAEGLSVGQVLGDFGVQVPGRASRKSSVVFELGLLAGWRIGSGYRQRRMHARSTRETRERGSGSERC